MKTEKKQIIASIAPLIVTLVFITIVDAQARARRFTGESARRDAVVVYRVPTQRDVYAVYRALHLHGAHAVHFNRHLNLVDYFPVREKATRPFPVKTYDIRSSYEEGLDSHNWLFIAGRNGLVRRVTAVLPGEDFQERSRELTVSSHAYWMKDGRVRGYAYDIPLLVAPEDQVPLISGPVVLAVDAGFFKHGTDPKKLVVLVREKLPDIRALVLVDSIDEEDVTAAMRGDLTAFMEALGGAGA